MPETPACPRDALLLVKSGLGPPSWLRISLCFAFYFGLHPLLSGLVLLINMYTLSPYVYAYVTDSYGKSYAFQ